MGTIQQKSFTPRAAAASDNVSNTASAGNTRQPTSAESELVPHGQHPFLLASCLCIFIQSSPGKDRQCTKRLCQTALLIFVRPGGNGPTIEDGGPPDVEQLARDQILAHIERYFKGHELSRLVDAVLQAEGYITKFSPPGPDGGVDILAGHGALGFDRPKLCVQVKSSQSAADVNVLRGLQGTMQTFQADQGLLVSWGGFNKIVEKEARISFFSVRLWDSDDLVEMVLRNYDRLSEELQNELPLKKVWALVVEE